MEPEREGHRPIPLKGDKMLEKLDNEDRFWLYLWVALGAFVATIATTAIITCASYDVKMAELGYEQSAIVGYSSPVWKKVRK